MTNPFRPRGIPKQTKPLSAQSWEQLRALDRLLLSEVGRDGTDYTSLRAMLDTIPRAERGVDWSERIVKIYCKHRIKAQRCVTLNKKIRTIREAEGKAAEFRCFLDELSGLTAPYVLTLHGYNLPFRNRDIKEVTAELHGIMGLLDGLGVQSFINSGTLLGAVRDGTFLGHDDDADLAVLIEGTNNEELVNALFDLGHRLNRAGVLQEPAAFSKGSPLIKIKLKTGVVVDLFPMWVRDGRVFIWPHTYGELHHDDVFPLGVQKLNNVAFAAPQDAQKMLALNYGEGWRSPDAHFQFPWNEAKRKFADFIGCYKRKRFWEQVFSAVPFFSEFRSRS